MPVLPQFSSAADCYHRQGTFSTARHFCSRLQAGAWSKVRDRAKFEFCCLDKLFFLLRISVLHKIFPLFFFKGETPKDINFAGKARRKLRFTYLITYLLNYSLEQSPSWKANRFSASQEIPRILWKTKAHYSIHKCPTPVPIMSQFNPVHAPLPLLEYPFLYYPPIYAWVFQVASFLHVSPTKPCIHLSPPPYVLHAPSI